MDGVPTANGRSVRLLRMATAFVAALAFVAVFVALLLYITHFHRTWFNSDDAVLNMLADAMWQQGRLLPQHWINNNGDLLVPSGALLIAPLLRWFPNGFAVHAVAGVFAALLLTGSLAWFLRTVRMPTMVILLLATLTASGLSFFNILMVFTQTTYVWWPAGFFLGAALIVGLRSSSAVSRRGLRTAALFALVFVVSFANPARVGLMMVFPLYAFDRVLAPSRLDLDASASQWKRVARTLGIDDVVTACGLIAAFLAAWVAYRLLAQLGITQGVDTAANLHWGGWDSVWRHARTLLGWFEYLGGGVIAQETSSRSFRGFGWFRWLVALGLTAIALAELLRMHKHEGPRRALAAAMLGAFVPVFLLYVFFEPLAFDITTLRYFTVAIYIAIASSAFVLLDLMRHSDTVGRVLIATTSVLLVLISLQRYVPVSRIGRATFWDVQASGPMRLAELLQREQLHRGYATWWNAGATTVMADSSVLVRPILLTPSGVSRFICMVSTDWYRPQPDAETFLVLARRETTPAELDLLQARFGVPERSIDVPAYRILVYAYDIAGKFDVL